MESIQKADCSTLMNNYKNVLTVVSFITSIDLIGWYFDFGQSICLLGCDAATQIHIFIGPIYWPLLAAMGELKLITVPYQRIRRVCIPRRSTYMGQIILFYTHLKYFHLDKKSIISHSLLKDCWLCIRIGYEMGIRLHVIGQQYNVG